MGQYTDLSIMFPVTFDRSVHGWHFIFFLTLMTINHQKVWAEHLERTKCDQNTKVTWK